MQAQVLDNIRNSLSSNIRASINREALGWRDKHKLRRRLAVMIVRYKQNPTIKRAVDIYTLTLAGRVTRNPDELEREVGNIGLTELLDAVDMFVDNPSIRYMVANLVSDAAMRTPRESRLAAEERV
jgi:hypothetical protein